MGDPLDAVAPYVLLVREICKSCQLGHDKAGRKERKPGQHRTTGGGADEHRAESTTPDSWTEPSAEGSCWPIAAATGGGRRLARSSVTRSTPCGASSSGARHTSAVEPRSTRSARRCRISSSTPPYASSAPQTRCVRRQADQVDVATSEHRPSLRIDARDPVSTGSRGLPGSGRASNPRATIAGPVVVVCPVIHRRPALLAGTHAGARLRIFLHGK
jgi:hypothetical protein